MPLRRHVRFLQQPIQISYPFFRLSEHFQRDPARWRGWRRSGPSAPPLEPVALEWPDVHLPHQVVGVDPRAWKKEGGHAAQKALHSGAQWSLGIIAFLAVFPEGAETVLFPQALAHSHVGWNPSLVAGLLAAFAAPDVIDSWENINDHADTQASESISARPKMYKALD